MSATTSETDDAEYSPVEEARDEIQDAVPEAAEKLRELLDAEDERIQIRAAEAILARAGLSKASKTQVSTAKEEVGGATKEVWNDNHL
jgi:hypothetical protein